MFQLLLITLALQAPNGDQATRMTIEALIRNLGNDVFQIREQASKKLVDLGDVALPALQDASKVDDPEIAQRAKDAVGAIMTKRVPKLAMALKDAEIPTRLASVNGIIEVLKAGGNAEIAIPQLIVCLRDTEQLIGVRSALALGALKAKAAIPQLGKVAADPNAKMDVRTTSLHALRRMGPDAIPAVRTVAEQGDLYREAKEILDHLMGIRP